MESSNKQKQSLNVQHFCSPGWSWYGHWHSQGHHLYIPILIETITKNERTSINMGFIQRLFEDFRQKNWNFGICIRNNSNEHKGLNNNKKQILCNEKKSGLTKKSLPHQTKTVGTIARLAKTARNMEKFEKVVHCLKIQISFWIFFACTLRLQA